MTKNIFTHKNNYMNVTPASLTDKSIIIIFFINIFLSLQLFSQSEKSLSLNFEDFTIKNTSIRAIEVIDDSTVWFAGSNGKFGRIKNNLLEIDSIAFNDKYLNFRSIAYNGSDIYFMSIENPTIIYKKKASALFSKRPYIVYGEAHEKAFYNSMTFIDNKNGIAMGDPIEDCLSVIITKDGGNKWKKIDCTDLPEVLDGEGAFAASNTNIATYKNNIWIVTGGTRARVFKSENKGKNWEVYETPIIQGNKMTGIFTVDFYNENTGIIMGGNWEEKSNFNATKALTNDGGKTWELIANKKTPGYISCTQYVPNTQGKKIVSVSTEGIYLSTNSGSSWKKISDKKYYSIRFVDNNTAWLSGNEIISKLKFN